MPGPVALAPSHIFHLNVRVPKDLVDRVRGTNVTLPIDGKDVTVKIGEKVLVSLRTRGAGEARARFAAAFAALQAHWEAVRRGPKPLTHKQLVALSGDVYRDMVGGEREDEPGEFRTRELAHAEAVEAFASGDPAEGSPRPRLAASDATFLAELQLPFGPQLLTWRHGGDLRTAFFSLSYRQALEDLFGAKADAVCGRHHLELDAAARLRLLEQVGQATIAGTARLRQHAEGNYAPDSFVSRFPTFDREARVTVAILFERWKDKKKDVVTASTVRRYTPSLNSLAAFLKDKDIRRISQDDIWDWAEHRRDVDVIAPATVNGNDLVAAASVFTFATTRDGKRLRPDNPVAGVRLVVPKRKRLREPIFRPHEVKAILSLARSVKVGGVHARQAASRRWVPWICAYSGARVQEPCWLQKKDFWRDEETGIWVMRFPQTKTGRARIVPLHEALMGEGLIEFVQAAPDGYLFVEDGTPRRGVSRTIQEQRASQIAEWIRDYVPLEDGVDPNHGWRHTFVSRATGRMDKRIQNAICGHNEKRDVSDGYFTATVSEMKAGLDRFPRFIA